VECERLKRASDDKGAWRRKGGGEDERPKRATGREFTSSFGDSEVRSVGRVASAARRDEGAAKRRHIFSARDERSRARMPDGCRRSRCY
jgi:hypothetical protein